jgi:hypothetical protein
VAGGAAAAREASKRARYETGDPNGYAFVPLVVESYGRMGKAAMGLLNTLAATAVAGGARKKSTFVTNALRQLQIQLLPRELNLGTHLLQLLRLQLKRLLLLLQGLLLQLCQQLLLLQLLSLLLLPMGVVWNDGAGIGCHAGGILLLNHEVPLPRIQPHCRKRAWEGRQEEQPIVGREASVGRACQGGQNELGEKPGHLQAASRQSPAAHSASQPASQGSQRTCTVLLGGRPGARAAVSIHKLLLI